MIRAPRARILTDTDRAGGTGYKTREEMKPMILFFYYFFLVEYITASICKLICNVIICCFCHRSAARVVGLPVPQPCCSEEQPRAEGSVCVCAHGYGQVGMCKCTYGHTGTYMCVYTHMCPILTLMHTHRYAYVLTRVINTHAHTKM